MKGENNMIKKLVPVFLCFSMVFSLLGTNVAKATEQTGEEELNVLLDELLIAHANNTSDTYDEWDLRVMEIEAELERFGFYEMTEDDLTSLRIGTENVSPRVVVPSPSDSTTIEWYFGTNEDYSYGGNNYDIKRVIAVGTAEGKLRKTAITEIRDMEAVAIDTIETLMSIYASKSISNISSNNVPAFFKWLPYELLEESPTTSVHITSVMAHHSQTSMIMFTYVKESSMSDDQYMLSQFSNKVNFTINGSYIYETATNVTRGYVDTKSAFVSANSYGSLLQAVKAYRSEASRYDYLEGYTVKVCNRADFVFDFPNFGIGPEQLY